MTDPERNRPFTSLRIAQSALSDAVHSAGLRSEGAFRNLDVFAEAMHNNTSLLLRITVDMSELNLRGEGAVGLPERPDDTPLWTQASAEVAGLYGALVHAVAHAQRYEQLTRQLAEAGFLYNGR